MLNTFIQKYFLPPVGITPENRVFSLTHIIISTILFALVFCIFYSVVKKRNQEYSNKVLQACAWTMLLLEIFRIGWNTYFHGLSITNFRFDFCNQICMFLPFMVILGNKKVYPYIELLSIVGGLVVLIYPLWVFYDYAGFHIMALQSMTSHALMLICGLVMPFASGYIPSAKDSARDSVIGFSIILVIAFIMSQVTGVNYLLMKGADGVPIIQYIPFPLYWLLLIPLSFVAAYTLSILYHDMICYLAHISLRKSYIYNTNNNVTDEVHALQSLILKVKFFHPLKYLKLKAQYEGQIND